MAGTLASYCVTNGGHCVARAHMLFGPSMTGYMPNTFAMSRAVPGTHHMPKPHMMLAGACVAAQICLLIYNWVGVP